MGIPQARWLVYFTENPIYKWMITGGTPISGNLKTKKWGRRDYLEDHPAVKKMANLRYLQNTELY